MRCTVSAMLWSLGYICGLCSTKSGKVQYDLACFSAVDEIFFSCPSVTSQPLRGSSLIS